MPHPLLDGLVDYAGLFPPARLPLEKAYRAYRAHLLRPEAWMLARFVVPSAHVGALAALAGDDVGGAALPLALLGTGGANVDAFLAALASDLVAVSHACARAPGLAPDAFELRLPDRVIAHPDTAAGTLARAHEVFVAAGFPDARRFYEVPFTDAGRAALPVLAGALADHGAGLKLRTGGLTPDDFPTADALAGAILAAHHAGIPFKATAGLHHPVRMHRDEVGAKMHGFLNVFGGACLLHARGLDERTLDEILREEDPAAFRLDASGFAWRGLSASPGELRAARAFATSFGSCSFDDPIDDLRALSMV